MFLSDCRVETRERSTMKAHLSRLLTVAAALYCVWQVGMMLLPEEKGRQVEYFPNHTVIAHDGAKYRFYDDLVKDRIVVINFIYTTCTDLCGLQTARMALIQDRLGNRLGKDLFIYSITLDPERDTPGVLSDFAAAFNPRPGWLFLTGQPDELHGIRFKLGERSRKLTEHQSYVVLGNGRTGQWSRTSMMRDIRLVVDDILEMDPKYRNEQRLAQHSPNPDAQELTRQLTTQTGQALFLKTCAACHNIGNGLRVGPDLAGITKRREVAWLKQYITRPGRMRAKNDPIALALRQQYKNVLMPYLGLSEIDVSDILIYIQNQTLKTQRSSEGSPPGN